MRSVFPKLGEPMTDAMKPLCFVLMPFGRKVDQAGRMIDFDAVYQQVIAPSVLQADLQPMRADQEQIGGMIHSAMFERLLLSEFALADVTGANPNVLYELGIRHATRPRTTIILFAEGTALPFDIGLLRGIPYAADGAGLPLNQDSQITVIAQRLKAARREPSDDSPVFQLVDGMPRSELDPKRTKIFQQHIGRVRQLETLLDTACRGGRDALQQFINDQSLSNIANIDPGLLVKIFMSFGEVKAYQAMVEFYERMPQSTQRLQRVQERLSLALMRLHRYPEAERVLKQLLAQHGPNSETLGLLGNLYTAFWQVARKDQKRALEAQGLLRRAISEYVAGFLTDWRDPFPGNNAIMLMEIQGPPFDQRDELIPVVHFSAKRRAEEQEDFWGYGNVMQLAVLTRDRASAENAAAEALAACTGEWQAEVAAHNLRLIGEYRAQRGENVNWIYDLEKHFVEAEKRRVSQLRTVP